MMNINPALKDQRERFSWGAASIDARLNGIPRGTLHEIYADADQQPAAMGFGLMLALRADNERPVVIVRDDRSVRSEGRWYADGIVELGGDPRRFILVHTADAVSLLRVAADTAACGGVATVLVEAGSADPRFDLTATRRIALRAERSGVLTLVVRGGAQPVPSAALTRWRVASAPSLSMVGAPGRTAFEISLVRHRGGVAGFTARVEWDRDQRSFRDAPLSGAVPAVAAGGARGGGWRRAA